MTFCQDAHRGRVFRLCDARTAGRYPLTTEAGGALLRWIVSQASGVYSEHVRVVRISYTLSRDTTGYQVLAHCKTLVHEARHWQDVCACADRRLNASD